MNATYALKDELDLLVEFRTTFLKSATADAIYREIALEIQKNSPRIQRTGRVVENLLEDTYLAKTKLNRISVPISPSMDPNSDAT